MATKALNHIWDKFFIYTSNICDFNKQMGKENQITTNTM